MSGGSILAFDAFQTVLQLPRVEFFLHIVKAANELALNPNRRNCILMSSTFQLGKDLRAIRMLQHVDLLVFHAQMAKEIPSSVAIRTARLRKDHRVTLAYQCID